MWYWRVLFLNSLALATACGTSRSTRSQNCSNLRAVVDQKSSPANASTIESYDPSAALLLFKATADKVSIEVPLQCSSGQQAGGQTQTLGRPVD